MREELGAFQQSCYSAGIVIRARAAWNSVHVRGDHDPGGGVLRRQDPQKVVESLAADEKRINFDLESKANELTANEFEDAFVRLRMGYRISLNGDRVQNLPKRRDIHRVETQGIFFLQSHHSVAGEYPPRPRGSWVIKQQKSIKRLVRAPCLGRDNVLHWRSDGSNRSYPCLCNRLH